MLKPPMFRTKFVIAVKWKGEETARGIYSGFHKGKAAVEHEKALERLYNPKSPVVEVITMSKEWLVSDSD